MQNKGIIAMIVVCLLFIGYYHFSSEPDSSSASETVSDYTAGSAGVQRINGLSDAYAELTDITKNGCRLHISGNSQYEISNHFILFKKQGSEMVPMETLAEFPETRTTPLSQAGITKDCSWAEFYGPLAEGEYSIMFTLIQGGGSVSFTQDFVIR